MHRVSLRAKGKTHQAGCSQHVNSVFVGYCDETKGYCFYNPTSRTITISGDAKFVEHGYWHTPDDSSSTPAVSLEALSNKSAVIEVLDPVLTPPTFVSATSMGVDPPSVDPSPVPVISSSVSPPDDPPLRVYVRRRYGSAASTTTS
jgi:hypothetical protein